MPPQNGSDVACDAWAQIRSEAPDVTCKDMRRSVGDRAGDHEDGGVAFARAFHIPVDDDGGSPGNSEVVHTDSTHRPDGNVHRVI